MGPALERLLNRPSSLQLLRLLVGPQAQDAPRSIGRQCSLGRPSRRDHSSAAAVSIRRVPSSVQVEDHRAEISHENPPSAKVLKTTSPTIRQVLPKPLVQSKDLLRKQISFYGEWGGKIWTTAALEFESNLDDRSPQRLLNNAKYKEDFELWAFLLEYRQRKYPFNGVLMFWNAVANKAFHLPTSGHIADKIWATFLEAAFQGHIALESVCNYADKLFLEHGQRWAKLYVQVLHHFLTRGTCSEALKWHERLQENHAAGNRRFLDLCKKVVSGRGNLTALKMIYAQSNHHNVYTKVIPVLTAQEDYKAALEWHFLLVGNGDYPQSSKVVEPLIHFLAIYDRPSAVRVTSSLVKANVTFAGSLSSGLQEEARISREMLNLVHAKTFHVHANSYNDNLGARWFATKWVSLDVAMNTVHALGVQEIGPLSLQSIALRQPDAASIIKRIDQLKYLGISIGASAYSRAVEHLARSQQDEYLSGLLQSDQHPLELEDRKLQEGLLHEYARVKDWVQYRRTLEIRNISTNFSETERRNIVLRTLLTRENVNTVAQRIQNMTQEDIPIQPKTISSIIQCVLRPRQQGHRPMTSVGSSEDLEECIQILHQIIRSGNQVPITHWREIIRRLGMSGNFLRLEQLCLELTHWYGADAPLKHHHRILQVPLQVPTSHPLHPLKLLFSASLQKAIVEWGFIHGIAKSQLEPFSKSLVYSRRQPSTISSLISGITLLKTLSQKGVYIDGKSVRSAIFNRLITYYGPGRSDKLYNRRAKETIGMSLEEVAAEIDQALGGEYLQGVNIVETIASLGARRMRKVSKKNARRILQSGALARRDPAPLLQIEHTAQIE